MNQARPNTRQATARTLRRPLCAAARIDALEPRQLLAAYQPTVYEQYMLELLNRARANPASEALRLGIALNEGVSSGSAISPSAKQPLVMNGSLVASARDHSNWLRANSKFQHAGSGGSSAQQRMTNAGYSFTGNYSSAENIGMTLGSSLGDLTQRVETLYKNLFLDSGTSGRGHRVNITNGALGEVGVGIATGAYTYNGTGYTAIIGTQDFAARTQNPFLLGVVFNDRNKVDNFYSPGEGMEGITITATDSAGIAYTTTTNAAGAYQLQVPAGTYTIVAVGATQLGTATQTGVIVGSENVKRDFQIKDFSTNAPVIPPPSEDQFYAAVDDNGKLVVFGTAYSDGITVTRVANNVVIQSPNRVQTFVATTVKSILVYGQEGDDSITIGLDLPSATITGGPGNDTLIGTAAADYLYGAAGNDVIYGQAGNDTIVGGDGNDQLLGGEGTDSITGEAGDDQLYGALGNDYLSGGDGNDRIYGESGNDYLDGGAGSDRLFGGLGNDTLVGGSQNDRLYGEDGHDLLYGKTGVDYFDGGGGKNRTPDRVAGEILA